MEQAVTLPSRIAAVLRLVADFVARLSETEIDALLTQTAYLQISRNASPKRRSPRSKGRSHDPARIAAALRGATTRDEAMVILTGEGVTKAVLEKLARQLDLPVLRSDSGDRLRQKIIEAIVGYRINSEAIQGRPPESAE